MCDENNEKQTEADTHDRLRAAGEHVKAAFEEVKGFCDENLNQEALKDALNDVGDTALQVLDDATDTMIESLFALKKSLKKARK